MTTATDIFIVPTPADRTTLLSAIPRIHFPWELLLPDLQRAGKPGFTVEFADLSAFTPPAHGEEGHSHDDPSSHAEDNHGQGGHVMYGNRVPGLPEESAAAAWGLFWFDGRIQIERTLRGQQSNIDWVLSAEIAHAVDVFYMQSRGMRAPINALMHGGGSDAHPWFGGSDYFAQAGEGWMSVFGVSWSDFVEPDPRFAHSLPRTAAPTVRGILKAPRTDEVAPPPPPPPSELTLAGASNEQFDAEFNRRYGVFKDVKVSNDSARGTTDIDVGFTKSAHRWQGHFEKA